MQIFEDNDTISPLYRRALSLTISKDFASEKNGKMSPVERQNSEQANRRRELLAVEEQANKDKIIEEHGQNYFREQVMAKFYAQVSAQINSDFENKEKLYKEILSIDDAAPAVMEILSVKAASINRITPLVKSLPWLASDVVNLVNKPQYRKRADVQVTEPSLALSYIGLDNLKLVMPTFILKSWLPVSTAPYPLMKRKLWNDSLSVALASKVLAKAQGIDDFSAFTAGMLSNIGLLAVTRCFLNTFNEIHSTELRAAYDERDKKLHDILVQVNASPELLLEQLAVRSSKIAADLVEQMGFERLQITEALFDLAYGNNIRNMCPIAQIVAKAKAYVAFRSLAKEDLIAGNEAKSWLSAVKLTPNDINLLKKSDIDHIKLNFK
ncbi:HDOD domain-containing protein [Colwelliaceae bacterium 6471]